MESDHSDRLARIETKLDLIVTALTKSLDDHEARIRLVEKKVYWFSGAAAVVGALAGKFGLPWPH
jgi:hypothetical protein